MVMISVSIVVLMLITPLIRGRKGQVIAGLAASAGAAAGGGMGIGRGCRHAGGIATTTTTTMQQSGVKRKGQGNGETGRPLLSVRSPIDMMIVVGSNRLTVIPPPITWIIFMIIVMIVMIVARLTECRRIEESLLRPQDRAVVGKFMK